MDQFPYSCTIDAEPLHRYAKGGYHPITLGGFLADGRYKILHKLGWGGYSTVWAARDEREGTYVAVKIRVAEEDDDREHRELNVMKKLASIHPHSPHVMHVVDDFDLEGPNGTHRCLVFELLGPSVPDMIDARFSDGRLPGKLAKTIAKQVVSGLEFLHQEKIGHGEIGHVHRSDGKALEPGIPEYVVRPAGTHSWPLSNIIKIVDFGESFLQQTIPQTLHTPLTVRAPEVIFGDHLDYRVDLWSLGCLLFELFVGQLPFDSFLITPKILVDQMLEMTSEALPERWLGLWEAMGGGVGAESSGPGLQEWLGNMYFDGERREDFTSEDIAKLGQIIRKLLRFEPSARASASEILSDPWFRD
ncbi:serine/threonine-protein kinase [Aspergillus chevalieri]|uniref:Protein kinase domain-containing protein n=1 Tax=Aspergillus chevalieri TaxID=182096 RepID=A0A7R7ZP15_ASPCH|nr:uncharacterized protein ACHE_40798A [Aspergillus chevalieri]BCR88234.1 hypothetical protein ACHE_40798A [Aspergillus chevalieri]